MEDEPRAYMGMRPLSGVPPLRRKDVAMKEEFSSLMQTKLYALLEAFLAEEEKGFKGFKRLWTEQRLSALYHVDFGNITRPEITYVMLRECLASLLQAISLYEWSIEHQRCENGGGLFLWHVVGCTYALYSAYECQITPIKQKILLHLDGAVALAKIPMWTDLWRQCHPIPTREVERMLQHLESKGAFCKCVQGYSFPPDALRLPAAPPDEDLALEQLNLNDSTAEDEDAASAEVAPFALDTGDIERLHNEYLEAMASFRVAPKEGKAAAGHRRRAAVLFNMPPASAQKQLAGFVDSLHRVLHPTPRDDEHDDQPQPSDPPAASNQPIQDEAALAAILQADLESELQDEDDAIDEATAPTAPLRVDDEGPAFDRGRQDPIGIERGDESAAHATMRDEIAAELDSDDDDDSGWAQDLEDELTSTSHAVEAAAPTAQRSSVAVALSLSSSNSSDDDDAFEAEVEASVLASCAASTSQETRSMPATAATLTHVSTRPSRFRLEQRALPPTSVWMDAAVEDMGRPVASVHATPETEALPTRTNASVFNMDAELSGLSSSSDSSDTALDELEQELVATSEPKRRDGAPTENVSGPADPPEPRSPATLRPPTTVVQPNQAKADAAASLAPPASLNISTVASEPAPRRVDPVRPRPSQPTARSLARSRAREMLLQPPALAAPPRQLQSAPALSLQPRGDSSSEGRAPNGRAIEPTTGDSLAPTVPPPVAPAPEPALVQQHHVAQASPQLEKTVTAVPRPREAVKSARNGATLPPPPSPRPVIAPTTSEGPKPVAIQPSQPPASRLPLTSRPPSTVAAVQPALLAIEPGAPRTTPPRTASSISQAANALKKPAMRRQPVAATATPATAAIVSSTGPAMTVQREAAMPPKTIDTSSVHRVGRQSDDSSSDGLGELEKELGVISKPKRVAPTAASLPTKPRAKPAASKRPAKPAISPHGAVSTDDDDLAELETELGILPRTSTATKPQFKPPGKRPAKPKTPPRGRPVPKQPGNRVTSQDGAVSSDDDLAVLEKELGIARHNSGATAQPRKPRTTPSISQRPTKPAMLQGQAVSTDEDLAELEIELGIAPQASTGSSSKASKPLEIKPKARAAARKTGQPKQKAPSQPKHVARASSSDSDLEALNKELGIAVAKQTRPPAATPPPPAPGKRQRVEKPSAKLTPAVKRRHAASIERGSDGDGTSNDEALAELERELNATPHPKMDSLTRHDHRATASLHPATPRPNKRQKTPPG